MCCSRNSVNILVFILFEAFICFFSDSIDRKTLPEIFCGLKQTLEITYENLGEPASEL